MEGVDPAGTLECPDGYVLDENLSMCVPEDPMAQASSGNNFVRLEDVPSHLRPKVPKKKAIGENAAPFKPTGKMERCIRDVKANLIKKNPNFKNQNIKSSAIAICRSRLKQ